MLRYFFWCLQLSIWFCFVVIKTKKKARQSLQVDVMQSVEILFSYRAVFLHIRTAACFKCLFYILKVCSYRKWESVHRLLENCSRILRESKSNCAECFNIYLFIYFKEVDRNDFTLNFLCADWRTVVLCALRWDLNMLTNA